MKKLFEVLFIFVFSVTFSGALLSNSLNKNLEKGIKTDFIRSYEINDNTTETDVTNQAKSKNSHIAVTPGDISYSEVLFDIAIPENQLEILMVNNNSDSIEHASSISLDEEIIASFNVFPNPAIEKLFVRFKGWKGIKEIKLLDITGRSVLIFKSGEELNEIDISTFPKGIYLIAVKNEFHYEVKKIKIQ